MRTLKFLLQKEFLQIFRNRAMLPIMFVMPIIQLVVLVFAADFELKNITYVFLDEDKSQTSTQLMQQFAATNYFKSKGAVADFEAGMRMLDNNEATLFIRIPPNFDRNLAKTKSASIMLDVNSIDGQAATLSFSYATGIINQYNNSIRQQWNGLPNTIQVPVTVEKRYWFNPEMQYKNLMVPGILALLITMIGLFLSSMNVVREKEIGTIEQINVTPIRKIHFLIGKLFPFWLIALFELGFGLTVGYLVFSIPINGSLILLFSYSALYLLVVLGMGLWISTITDTQQQAMFLAWFVMVIFLLMSGLFTPIENMPNWAQKLTWFNPVAYMVHVVRSVLLKGSTFGQLQWEFAKTALFAAAMLGLAIGGYRKRS